MSAREQDCIGAGYAEVCRNRGSGYSRGKFGYQAVIGVVGQNLIGFRIYENRGILAETERTDNLKITNLKY